MEGSRVGVCCGVPGRTRVASLAGRPSDTEGSSGDFCAPSVSSGLVDRSEEHTSELQSLRHLVCRLLLEKKKPGLYEAELNGGILLLRHKRALPGKGAAAEDEMLQPVLKGSFFFFNDAAPAEIYPLSLHAPLPI